jgi:rare lipoprotein A (peptidoglycan hydrolase)
MRIMAILFAFAWAGLHATSASAQSFDDRWSIIPKAHAEEPPRDQPTAPAQTPTDQSGQHQQSPTTTDTTVGSANSPARQTIYGRASFYSYIKGKTASGAPFDRNMPTAAHRTLPFGTTLRVTNLTNNKSVVVTVTDRGPHAPGRILDLSLNAARSLEIGDRGVVDVRAEVL